ncbi:nuclear transport factor 2 family protein [uncultured Roseobacter sp.]|uniref:YybH family protein n=1 Tax=uncultured Roseobacter sp. TaxID=114847 RepID=UPI0026131195|nr:nuclear transport factor 2 family protein [uncultured Roseobacter sp.]
MTQFFKTTALAAVLALGVTGLGQAQDTPDDAQLRQLTGAWVAGWSTSPDAPFSIDQIADLYVQDERLFSYDFGRPHNGVEGWEAASRYYEGFMALPAEWTLVPADDMRVTVRGDIAWTTVSLSGSGAMPNGDPIAFPEARVTLIFEKQEDGAWRIIHEHGSSAVPFPDPETTRSLISDDRN